MSFRRKSEASRSPLKELPLRLPGQSLEEERRVIVEDSLEPWLLTALLFVVLAAVEWWRFLTDVREVHSDGEQLKVGNFAPDRDPVKQAQATARWLTSELLRSTGKDLAVWPVVLFPGWFVRQSDTSLQRCWVLEPKALPGDVDGSSGRKRVSVQ